MVSSTGFALLIGIDRYPSLDASAELLGSRNDVLMWHWFCRQHLGIPAKNIRMITSPPLDPTKDFSGDTIPADTIVEATEENIRKGYAWLLESMSGGKNPGLLTYSGHGTLLNGAIPALSTANTKSDLTGTIPLRDIGKAIQEAKAEQALTAVFDCCHLAAPATRSSLRTPTGLSFGATDAASIEDQDFNVSQRVFLAARPGQAANQGKLGRHVHGALSFSLVTAAEQWKASEKPDQTGLDVNHKQLFKRARKLLRSLRMKQSPKLRVPFDPGGRSFVRKMPFFGLHPDLTTRKPDAVRQRIQLDPNASQGDYTLYTLTLSTGPTAQVLSVANLGPSGASSQYQAGTEYWNLSTEFLTALAAMGEGSSLQFTGTTSTWLHDPAPSGWTGSTSSPTMASGVTWVANSGASPKSTSLWNGNNYGIYISGTSTAPSVSWYIIAATPPAANTYVVSAAGMTFYYRNSGVPTPQPNQAYDTPKSQSS